MKSFTLIRLPMRPVTCIGFAIAIAVSFACLAPSHATAQDDPTVPVFEDGEAQVVPGFSDESDWIRHDLWVEAEFDSDGDGKLDRMHVAVCRQKQTDTEDLKVPVVYVSSPYFSGTGVTSAQYFWDPKHEIGETPPERGEMPSITHLSRRPVISNSHVRDWVPRGYAVVHSASPGTGLSQGCPTVGGDNESLAPKAVVDWLNGRAKGFTSPDGDEEVEAYWTTGKVGMTGTSYNGTIPLAAATTGVEGLEAIIPIAPNTSYYHYYRSHGLVRHPGGYLGEDIDVLYDFINSGDPEMREYCDCNVRDELLIANLDRLTGDYNEFWAGRDYLNDMEPMKAALLMSHGFNDWNVMPEHSYRIYDAARAKGIPCQIFYHQGGHGGPPPMKMMNRWFTRYLFGVENGVEEDPRAWIVRESDRRTEPTAYEDYPHPQAEPVEFHLQGNGLGVGELSLRPVESETLQTLVDDVAFSGADLAQADESSHRLLFSTGELEEDLHISGLAKLNIRLACDKPAANLSVWMVTLPWTPEGRPLENIISRGWADPQNRGSLTESAPLTPGEFYELSFELQPDDQVIPAGKAIGVMIFSSDRDFTLWPDAGTELTVDLQNTTIEIPVVGGEAAAAKSVGN